MIILRRIDPADPGDRADLVAFMTGNEFPFHVRPRWTRAQVESAIEQGSYRDEDNDSFWVEHRDHGRIGLLRFQDLTDNAPLFDVRLDTRWRGRGFGSPIVDCATHHIFSTMPEVNRFEAQTRVDNVAMRRVLLRCGWVKEAHYREGWPVQGGEPVASVAYGILRRDWQTGVTTPVPWDDEPQ